MEDPEVVAKTPDGVGLMLSEAELLVEVSVIDGSPVRSVTAFVSLSMCEYGISVKAVIIINNDREKTKEYLLVL